MTRSTSSIGTLGWVNLLACVCSLFLCASVRAEDHYLVHKGDTNAVVRMRSQASANSAPLAYIQPGNVIASAGECVKKWCKVTFKDKVGWVFRDYLEPTDRPILVILPPGISDATSHNYKATANDPAISIRVQEMPGEGLAITGSIPGNAVGIQLLAECEADWCHVRYQQTEGWVHRADISADSSNTPPNNNEASNATASTSTPASTPSSEPQSQTLVSVAQTPNLDTAAEPKQLLHIVGLNVSASLIMRDMPNETARVVAVLGPDSDNIEDMKECVRQWCRVRYNSSVGFVLNRFLGRVQPSTTRYHVDGISVEDVLNVFDYPGSDAQVVGVIPSYANGLVPIGDCNENWCHIRYLGLVGWVRAENLAAEHAPAKG